MNSIEWHRTAKKDLRKVDKSQQKAVIKGVEKLQEPQDDWNNVIKLVNHKCSYRSTLIQK
ncbi:hypothetical protein SPONL_514 [uncultured Candidatus Thioglobus sp.]|nr:hypothetical protein SPONL_514 [uncultured Candidatus Thioglobus sp.]